MSSCCCDPETHLCRVFPVGTGVLATTLELQMLAAIAAAAFRSSLQPEVSRNTNTRFLPFLAGVAL